MSVGADWRVFCVLVCVTGADWCDLCCRLACVFGVGWCLLVFTGVSLVYWFLLLV